MNAGKNYAGELQDANRGVEARELLAKLLATSKQVLGPDHNVTVALAFESTSKRVLGSHHSITKEIKSTFE